MNFLPRLIRNRQRESDQSILVSTVIIELAPLAASEVLTHCKTARTGLSTADAAKRLAETGLNVVVTAGQSGWLWQLIKAMRNPLVMLLTVLTIIAFASGDAGAGSMMSIMILISFVQGAASWPIILTSFCLITIAISLPYSPAATALGFTALPLLYWPILFFIILGYGLLTHTVKMWLVRKAWL